ncbi:MAG: LysR family transcriptional regulator [Marinibacterium sp.]|nr:LysR family transcriptional regulator [Marinibacterium sp.]
MPQHSDLLVWDDVRAFLAVMRAGTLSGAAEQLGLGIATVSRRITRLEQAMGQPLFVRLQSGYQLTEDGAALSGRAEQMEIAALSLQSGLPQQAEVSGMVRLATAENLATGLIAPALGRLRAAYPRLALEIVTDVRAVNLHRRDADIALRMVKPDRGNVTVQRLGRLGFGLYGAPAYLAARPAPPDDALIGWTDTYAALPAARWIVRLLGGRGPVLATSSLASQFEACAAGLGLAVLPHFLARPRGLVCVGTDPDVDQAIWLVTHRDLAPSRRVAAVAGFLRDLVAENRATLGG